MNSKDAVNSFIRRLEDRAWDVPHGPLVTARRERVSSGQIHSDEDVDACIARAKEIAREEASGTKRVRPVPPVRENMVARVESYLRLLGPQVMALRRHVLGTETPLASLQAAAQWVEQQGGGAPVPFNMEAMLLVSDAATQARAMDEWSDYEAVQRPIKLDYLNEDRKPASVPVRRGTALDHLRHACDRWSELTGLRSSDLCAYVLAGVKPNLNSSIELGFDEIRRLGSYGDPPIHRTVVRVRMDSRDVTDQQFEEVYRYIRRHLGLTRKKAMNAEDSKLIEVVRSHGGPPAKFNSKKFWDGIRRDQRLARWPKSPAAWREKYRRLKPKFSRNLEA